MRTSLLTSNNGDSYITSKKSYVTFNASMKLMLANDEVETFSNFTTYYGVVVSPQIF